MRKCVVPLYGVLSEGKIVEVDFYIWGVTREKSRKAARRSAPGSVSLGFLVPLKLGTDVVAVVEHVSFCVVSP